MEYVGLKDSKHFTDKYLSPLVLNDKIKLTIPEKPKSKNQKYITVK